MGIIKRFFDRFLKSNKKEEEWLSYYDREKNTIEYTKKSIYEYLIESVGDDKDYIALNYFGNKINYTEFLDNIDIAARALTNYGIKKNDIVTICLPNIPEAIYAFYACNKIGAVVDIIHPLSSTEQVKFYLQESKSRYLFLVDFGLYH